MKIDLRKLKRLYNTCKNQLVELESTDNHNVKAKINNELSMCRFCPPKILEYFQKCTLYLKLQIYNIVYHIYYADDKDLPPISKIIKSIQQSAAVAKYFDITKMLNVYIVMAPYQRMFPPLYDIITADNINGGFTTHEGNNIYIFRSEEFSKVILHEILHHSPKVHYENWNASHINMLKNAFNIHEATLLIPNEAVVELWATILHIGFISFDYMLEYNDILKAEIEHSIMQSKKMLDKQKTFHKSQWREETNAFCYVVFKTILLANLASLDLKMTPECITKFLIKNKLNLNKSYDKSMSLRIVRTSSC